MNYRKGQRVSVKGRPDLVGKIIGATDDYLTIEVEGIPEPIGVSEANVILEDD